MLNVSVLTDPGFCPHSLNKYASIMACGNGYMGIRAAHEEDYTQQTRGMYLAGLYHRAGRNETTELSICRISSVLMLSWMASISRSCQAKSSSGSASWRLPMASFVAASSGARLTETLSSGEPSFCVAGPVALSGHAAFDHTA
jgi:hypothetical protein